MFDIDGFVEDAAIAADLGVPTFDRLKKVLRLKSLLDAAEAELVAGLAEENGWSEGDEFDVVGTRAVRVGADGTRLVREDFALELAVAQGVSVGAATWYLRDVANLDARHPYTWLAVQDGRLPLWRARKIAQLCADAGLDHAQALRVDEVLEPVVGRVGWRRTTHMLRAAMMMAAPQLMTADAERRSRFCRKQASDDPGTSVITAMVDTADAIFFDATVQRLAEVLAEQGDGDDTDRRRAKAVGILASPARALTLLGVHTRRGIDDQPDQPVQLPEVKRSRGRDVTRPVCKIYVHMHAETLSEGVGVARVEDVGPILIGQVAKLVGHAQIRLTPVVHLGDASEPAVDAYEIPQRIRDAVFLRDRHEVFPFSSREVRHLDVDHTIPYRAGRSGQTRASNLGPLSRPAHRAKTHTGWQLVQTAPGVFWWKSPLGQVVRVGPDGTQRFDEFHAGLVACDTS